MPPCAILLKLDRIKGVSEHVKKGLRVLKSFVGLVTMKVEGVEFAVDIDGEPGVADSGRLSRDLAEVFVAAGDAARDRNTSIVILFDEIQTLPREEFEALIMANQHSMTGGGWSGGSPTTLLIPGRTELDVCVDSVFAV